MPNFNQTTYSANQGGYSAPPGYSVVTNIQNAQAYAASHSTQDTYYYFFNQVTRLMERNGQFNEIK